MAKTMGPSHLGTFRITLKLLLGLFTLLMLVNGEGIQDIIDYDVTAVEDGTAALPCNLDVPHDRSNVSIVLWYKDKEGLPVYSLDFRRNTANGIHVIHDNKLKQRATFLHRERPGVLLLKPVQTEDAGIFRCRVDFLLAPTRNQRTRLRVIEPPKYVSIVDRVGNKVKGNITFKEGSTAVLTCQTDSGNPLPHITWWRGSALQTGSFEVTPDGTIKNELVIPVLSRQDLDTELTCQASNNNISLPATESVRLNLDLRPLGVDILTPEQSMSANREHEIKCQSYGSRPRPRMSWFKGSNQLLNHREFISDDRNVTTSILKFKPTEDDNGKFLTCRADNPHVFGSTKETSWTMDVHFPPTAVLQLGASLKEENLKEGDDVYFDCYITANPRIYKVDWKFNGVPLKDNITTGMFLSNQTLVLQKIKRTRMGAYSCVAYNTEGDGESNEVILKIKYAPYCKKGQKTLYGIAKHEAFPISCDVVSNPNAVRFKWAFNGSTEYLDFPSVMYQSSGSKSTLLYTPRAEKDYGLLYCWGENDIGHQREPCAFRVIAAGPPDSVKNCTIQNETESTVHIECAEGFDGGLEQRFGIEVFEALTNMMIYNITNVVPEFTVHDLDPGKGFLVHVFAFNSKGRSGAMTLVANTLRVAERRTGVPTLLTITPVLGVLIGIVAALVLVAVAIVVIMRLRHSDEEKKKNRENEILDRVTTPLKKEIDEMENLEEKNPDIVPTEDDHLYDDVHEKAALKLNNTNERIYENVPSMNTTSHREYENLNNVRNQAKKLRQNEDVMYAELQLPNNQRQVPVTSRRTVESTVYAQIDHTRKAPPISMDYDEDYPHNAETPLMTNHRESTV